jgi:hypothetical protein
MRARKEFTVLGGVRPRILPTKYDRGAKNDLLALRVDLNF